MTSIILTLRSFKINCLFLGNSFLKSLSSNLLQGPLSTPRVILYDVVEGITTVSPTTMYTLFRNYWTSVQWLLNFLILRLILLHNSYGIGQIKWIIEGQNVRIFPVYSIFRDIFTRIKKFFWFKLSNTLLVKSVLNCHKKKHNLKYSLS